MPGASSMAWLRGFGACGLAHMQGPPVGAAEGSGDALRSFKDPAKCGPTRTLAVLAQASTNHLHELIRDHGDEQMAFGDGPSDSSRGCGYVNASIRGSRPPIRTCSPTAGEQFGASEPVAAAVDQAHTEAHGRLRRIETLLQEK